MNKLLIVLLAACLVSVHAFVRREAPATASNSNPLDLEKLLNDAKGLLEGFSKNLDADKIKSDLQNVAKKGEELISPEVKKQFDDVLKSLGLAQTPAPQGS